MYVSLVQKSDVNFHIVDLVTRAKFKVAVTGAGISKASGLPLLRDTVDGVPLKTFFDGSLWRRNPESFYRSYRSLLGMFQQAEPNFAHIALARSGTAVVTQNIDGLHRMAGSRHLLEIHGNVRELFCPNCNLVESSERAMRQDLPTCPECETLLHPGIVLGGEEVRHVSRATDWVGRAEVLIIAGTRLSSHPVRELPKAVKKGVPVIEVNENAEILLPMLLRQEDFSGETIADS